MKIYEVNVYDNRGTKTSESKKFTDFDKAHAYLYEFLLKEAIELGDYDDESEEEFTSHTQIEYWEETTGNGNYNSSVLLSFEAPNDSEVLLVESNVE